MKPPKVSKASKHSISPSTEAIDKISSICSQVRSLSDQIKSLELVKKELSQEAGQLAESNNLPKLSGKTPDGESWILLKPADSTRSEIKKDLLVMNGVDLEVINKSTITKTIPGTWQVRPAKE